MGSAPERTYLFDNAAATAAPMHAYLSEILDPWTRKSIADTGTVYSGARCLDLGAGLGMVTAHLSDLVGPDGHVVAVDADPRHLDRWLTEYPNVEIIQADLRADPLPDGPWDLIVARSVLPWLPERECIACRAAGQLAVGGVLLTIDFRSAWDTCLLACTERYRQDAADLFRRYHRSFTSAMAAVRHEGRWWQQAFGAFRAAGLAEVVTRQYSKSWDGGSPGCMLPITTTTERQDALVEADAGHDHPMAAADFDRLREILHDPETTILGLPIYATAGRRTH